MPEAWRLREPFSSSLRHGLGGRECEGGGGENVRGECAIVRAGGSRGASEELIGAMEFAATETHLAVEELARTIGFEGTTDGKKAFGVRAGK